MTIQRMEFLPDVFDKSYVIYVRVHERRCFTAFNEDGRSDGGKGLVRMVSEGGEHGCEMQKQDTWTKNQTEGVVAVHSGLRNALNEESYEKRK